MALMLAPGLLLAADNDQATDKLARVQALAREIRMDASIIQTYEFTPSLVSRKLHQSHLNEIKKYTDEIAPIVQSLNKNRSSLEKWQDQLLNRLIPKPDTMSNEVRDAIKFYNDTQGESFFHSAYEDYVDGMYDQSNSIVNTIERYFKWADDMKAKEKIKS